MEVVEDMRAQSEVITVPNRRAYSKGQMPHKAYKRPYLELNNAMKCVIISFILIAVIFVGRIFVVNAADQKDKEVMHRYYTSITIQQNDTLWELSDQYNTGSEDKSSYIRQIMSMNNMTSDTLYQGENILVYYYSDEVK
jgi:hypothetical protein